MESSGEFQKFDASKPATHLLPPEALLGAAQVMGYGEKKYAVHNWRKATTWTRYLAAALRHLLQWSTGEDSDPESGYSHLDHAACCVLMLSSLTKTNIGEDDRWKPNS